MQPDGLRVRLVVPGNVRHNSGGNVYNAALARELAVLGVDVDICPLDGGWPVGSPEDRRRLAALLCDGDSADDRDPGAGTKRQVTLVDGLLACGAPEELAARRGRRPARLDPAPHAAGRHRARRSRRWNAGRCGPRPG